MIGRYWRLILFLVFSISFVITAPLVVFYTAGYRFEGGKVVQTGVLNTNSIPKSADVRIDGELQEKRTPAVFSNVIPGTRTIVISKDGYSSWQKSLDVFSRQSTFTQEVVLFLEPLLN